MRRHFSVLFVLLAATSAVALEVHVVSDQVLQAPQAFALDVRWASPDSVYLTTIDDGVLEVKTAHPEQAKSVAYPHVNGQRCFSCSELATSPKFIVTAFPAGGFAWKETASSATNNVSFDAIVDIDVHDDKLLLLGSRRENGAWAPDGAIAWFGTLSKNLSDLHPVVYSSFGAKAMVMGRCGFINPGGVRFFSDGSFVVAPGVEPGMYLYDAAGHLSYTWQTQSLGFFDRCDVPEEQRLVYMKDPEARAQWMNRFRMIDDVLALPDGPALVLREAKSGRTSWNLMLFRRGQAPLSIDLPFTAATDVAHLKADVRGDRIAFLIRLSARWRNNGQPTPGRLVLATWK